MAERKPELTWHWCVSGKEVVDTNDRRICESFAPPAVLEHIAAADPKAVLALYATIDKLDDQAQQFAERLVKRDAQRHDVVLAVYDFLHDPLNEKAMKAHKGPHKGPCSNPLCRLHKAIKKATE